MAFDFVTFGKHGIKQIDGTDYSSAIDTLKVTADVATIELPPTFGNPDPSARKGAVTWNAEMVWYQGADGANDLNAHMLTKLDPDDDGEIDFVASFDPTPGGASYSFTGIAAGAEVGGKVNEYGQVTRTFRLTGAPTITT